MRRIAAVATAALLLALAACERAGSVPGEEPDAALPEQACTEFPAEFWTDGVPKVPARLSGFVHATKTTLTVERASGAPACLDVSYGEVDAWDELAAGRLLGVGISGHEFNSYQVIDLQSPRTPIETGVKPVFSPSGRLFTSVDVSESAFGAFEGLGVWSIEEDGIRTLVTLRDLLGRGNDWKLERWASDTCLVFSSTDDATEDPSDRKFYELTLMAQRGEQMPEVPRDEACGSTLTAPR